MILSLIAAVANNNVIGKDNTLIWHLPADLKHFKKLTMGHSLIMGRKTFESIGKPLPGRKTIILTQQKHYRVDGCSVVNSFKEALGLVKDQQEVFVAGGAQVYEEAIKMVQTRRIYLTRVFACFDGDAFFPEIDQSKWALFQRSDHQPDEKNALHYSFQLWKRKH